jgi:hypothetical protein
VFEADSVNTAEIRFTVNFKIASDTATTTTVVVLVEDETDARDAGERVQKLTQAFMDGYNAAAQSRPA